MLQDSFGRRFYYLRLSVTDICNFRCTYCLPNGYQGEGKQSFLSASEIERAVQGFAAMGTRKVRLSGGEPGIRADLPDIIDRISSVSGIEKVALTTNGYKLPQKVEEWARAGLNQINVSIDSLDADTFHEITGHNRLAEVLEGVEMARSLGLAVKVNSVLMRNVNDDLTEVMDWLSTTPVTLRFIEVMETSDQQVFFRQHHRSGQTVKARLLEEGWQPLVREATAGPAEEFWHPDYAGRIGLIMPYSKDFCSSCNRLRISSLGKLHLCLFAEQGIDIRPYLQSSVPVEELIDAVSGYVSTKSAAHDLISHQSGAMANLSQIGG